MSAASEKTLWSVLVVGLLPDEVKADISAAFDARFFDQLTPDQLAAEAAGCDALFFTVNTPMRRATIEALPTSIKALGTYSVGHEHIDLDAVRTRGLALLFTPDVLTDAVAEAAMLLMLGAARRATESIALIRSQAWPGWHARQLVGVELHGKRLGIFGMGRIGRGVATLARAFGMSIHYHNRHRLPPEQELGAAYHSSFADMAGEIDVLLLATQSSPETQFYFNRERLALLKPGVILVNIGRGNLIDDSAVIEALRTGQIRAAGLDVFNNEPKLDPGYFELPNVFMLPHIGSSTIETRQRMGQILIDGFLALKEGRDPANRLV